jgi:hypothetical protein
MEAPPELEAPDPTLSSDARDSTYAPAAETKEASENPPSGPRVEQTLGKPETGGEPTPSKAKASTASSSSS